MARLIHSLTDNLSPSLSPSLSVSVCADDFNGAMLKAVCVEAGMIALRRSSDTIKHEDFVEGIQAVQMKKKTSLQYYA